MDYTLYVNQGWLWTNYAQGYREANNPDNPIWARGVLWGLAVLAAPLAGVEEYIARPIANVPFVVHNAGIKIGEYSGRAYLNAERGETGEAVIDVLHAVVSFSEGFVAAASVAEPFAGAAEARFATAGAVRGASTPALRTLEGTRYWELSPGGMTREAARDASQAAGFGFDAAGRVTRFNNARNAVIIGKDMLRNGNVNRLVLAEEIQHGLDRATNAASDAVRRGISNERFHSEVFQRIVTAYEQGRGFAFLTPEDIAAFRNLIRELAPR
jgi:hypothetical protein